MLARVLRLLDSRSIRVAYLHSLSRGPLTSEGGDDDGSHLLPRKVQFVSQFVKEVRS